MQAERLTEARIRALLPVRPVDGHKGTFGHLFVLAGSRGFMGASKLACRAAGRSWPGHHSPPPASGPAPPTDWPRGDAVGSGCAAAGSRELWLHAPRGPATATPARPGAAPAPPPAKVGPPRAIDPYSRLDCARANTRLLRLPMLSGESS